MVTHTRSRRKSQYNWQPALVKDLLQEHLAGRRSNFLAGLRKNDPKIYKVNKALIKAKEPVHPYYSPTGFTYEPAQKAEIFDENLVTQFGCPEGQPDNNREI